MQTIGHRKAIAGSAVRIGSSAVRPRTTQRCSSVAAKASALKGKIKKVVLAYSGGLDTSIILKWLQDEYGCEVVTFTADLGQGEELEPARAKAEKMGIKQIYIDDLRETFVKDYVFPMFRANSQYEGLYLLGTSIARPLIAKRQIEIAKEVGADAVCHGATGKGNDQVRFEVSYYALKPDIKVIAPWREWTLSSRTEMIQYAEKNGIPVPASKRGEAPYSMDANLLHISYEGNALEDPWVAPSESMFTRSVSPEQAPDKPTEIEIEFEKGNPVAIDGVKMSPATLLAKLNQLGGDNGVGRIDLVESRFVGMKSRGVYETPGGTILLMAHRGIESITLDRGESHLKDDLMPRYAELIYNGFWFSPEREALQTLIDQTQEYCTGTVRVKLYKGNVSITGRKSPYSLYDKMIASFEDDGGLYNQADAGGFIKLQALRLRTLGISRKKTY
jgi:argininosuccinate synthase